MATYESEFSTPGTSARIWLVLQVDVVSQNVTNNTTTLNWYLRGEERITNASPYNLNGVCSANATAGNLVFNNSGLNYDFRGSFATYNWGSGTTVVGHNSDGTKTITVAASFTGDSILGSASFSTTMALPTIPRATQPTVSPSSGQTATTFTIGHTPASSSFYHDVAYSLDGGSTYTDIQTSIVGTDTSTDWTPAHSLLPNTASTTAVIRLITRSSSGGTIIGTKTVNLPLSVPASVKPTVSSVSWVDDQTSGPDMPALMGGTGRFVQRWSKLKPTVTSSGAGGSTITSSSVTLNAQTTPSGTAFTNPVMLSGSVPFTASATDSRGRNSDTYVNTVAVTAYNFPNLPTPAVTRTSDSGGTTPSPTGTYLKIMPLASVSSLNFSGEKNLLEWQIRTRPVGGSWTTVQAWTNATVSGNTWTTPKIISGYASSTEYEVEVSIRDLFGKNGYDTSNTIKTLTIPVPSESVFMDWNSDLGIGLGQYHSGSGARLQVKDGISTDDLAADNRMTQRAGKDVLDEDDLASYNAGLVSQMHADNLIINGDFRVNQRGFASAGTLASGAYFLDRWYYAGPAASTASIKFTGDDNGRVVMIDTPVGNDCRIAQKIERASIPAGDYLLSWEGSAGGRIYKVGATAPSWATSPIAFTSDGSADVVVEFSNQLVGSGSTVSEVQLIAGTVAYPFRPRPIGEELALCLRYYFRLLASQALQRLTPLGVQASTTACEVSLVSPVVMRTVPVVSYGGSIAWTDQVSTLDTISALAIRSTSAASGSNVIPVNVTKAAGGAANRPGIVQAGSSGAWIAMDAEM